MTMTIEIKRNEVDDFVDEVLELLSGARKWDADDLAKMRERVQGGAERLKESASEKQQELREAVESAATKVDSYARENPWPVIAMAAGLGIALGVIISRR
jgi:ElaB/YqjD/DUF883 family membrane-anchored ribosome-binding protein